MSAVCKNVFLEEDGYCTLCGKNHLTGVNELTGQRPSVRTTVRPTVSQPVVDSFPYKQEILSVIKMLESEWGLKVEVKFTQYKKTAHTLDRRTGKHTIEFGRPTIEWHTRDGLHEYATVAPYVRQWVGQKGAVAARLVAIHEFAHAVDTELNGRARNVAHPVSWLRIYRDMLVKHQSVILGQ